MLRWRSDEAVKIYGRLNPTEYSDLLSEAMRADVASVRTTHAHTLPVVDADARAADMERLLPRMYADAHSEDNGDDVPLEGMEDLDFAQVDLAA